LQRRFGAGTRSGKRIAIGLQELDGGAELRFSAAELVDLRLQRLGALARSVGLGDLALERIEAFARPVGGELRLVPGGGVLGREPRQPLVLGDRAGELRVERADPLAARALLLHHGKLVLFGELLEPLALDAMVVCEARALLFLLLKRGDQTLLLGAALVQL